MKKVFFSWQSDTAGSKAFIMGCLREAVSDLPDWEIETATRNAQGAVDIAENIMTKINEATIVLSDVSIINPEYEGKKTPNPNVLYETGYAVGKKGWLPIILVANEETTSTSTLPFDIRNRLMILRRFEESNKNWLTRELRRILSEYAAPDVVLEQPYIYLELSSHSQQSMMVRAKNDEEQEYVMQAIEIDGSEQRVSRGLPGRQSTEGISITELPLPPFEHRIESLSFVVSRMNKSYRIYQRMNLHSRADERFGLTNFQPSPMRIEEIPFYREWPEIEPLPNTGYDGQKIKFTDVDTGMSFILAISGTLMGVWGVRYQVEETPKAARIGKAINDKKQGRGSGEYELSTFNAGSTLEDTINMILGGQLFS